MAESERQENIVKKSQEVLGNSWNFAKRNPFLLTATLGVFSVLYGFMYSLDQSQKVYSKVEAIMVNIPKVDETKQVEVPDSQIDNLIDEGNFSQALEIMRAQELVKAKKKMRSDEILLVNFFYRREKEYITFFPIERSDKDFSLIMGGLLATLVGTIGTKGRINR